MGRCFDVAAVQWVRHAYHLPSPSPFQAGELSVSDLAARLGISVGAVYDWIECGHLAARRTNNGRLCIAYPPEVEAVCRKRVAASRHMKPTSRKSIGS
jgi:excisionase family DNA binding protein